MAISTMDGVIAGMRPPESFIKIVTTCSAGRYRSLLYSTGFPGAGASPAPGINGAALTTYGGQIPFTNPGAGNSYLARFAANNATQVGTLLLCDRLWHNSGLSVTSTGSQGITSAAWPARDRDGAVSGADVLIGLEVTTNMGSGTPTVTLGYTNSAAVAGRSVVSAALPTTMMAGDFIPLPLQAGDYGTKSIETLQLSATMTSGAFSLVAYRILATVGNGMIGVDAALDALGTGLPRLYDNTVPFLIFLPSTTTAPTIAGQMLVTQG